MVDICCRKAMQDCQVCQQIILKLIQLKLLWWRSTIEEVDENKMTNAGNIKLEGGLTFILYNAHFYKLNLQK